MSESLLGFTPGCGEPYKEKLSIPKEEEAELKEVEKVEEAKTKEVTVKQEGLQELKAGQEFIYDGRKIVLTKYELEHYGQDFSNI